MKRPMIVIGSERAFPQNVQRAIDAFHAKQKKLKILFPLKAARGPKEVIRAMRSDAQYNRGVVRALERQRVCRKSLNLGMMNKSLRQRAGN